MHWNARNGSVPIGNTQMSFVSFGQGDKAFVILPGLSDGLTTVKGRALLLAKPYQMFCSRYTVYVFSRKDAMPQGYSIRDMANDQALAMKALGLRSASVMGVSQGGMIAQYLAIDHPELVEKLVIAVTAPRVNDMIRAGVNTWLEAAKQGDHKRLMIDTMEWSYSPESLKKFRMLYPVIGLIGKPKTYDRFRINADAILSFDALQEISKIACPTLILGGAADKTVGVEASYEMKERIPGSELYVYQGLGHAAFEEAADFNRRVFDFLEAEP